jgi:hypothetical protein
MSPIEIPPEWNDAGLITFEVFCTLDPTTHRPGLAATRGRTTLGTLQGLRPPLHHRRRSPPLPQLRDHQARPPDRAVRQGPDP